MRENEYITWNLIALKIYIHLENRKQSILDIGVAHIKLNLVLKGWGIGDPRSKPYIDELLIWISELLTEIDISNIENEANSWKLLSEETQIEKLRFLRAVKMRLKIAESLQENGLRLQVKIASLIPFINLLP